MCAQSLSRVWLFVTPWTGAYQAPLSMEFSRQEYWSGLPFPSPRESSWPRDQIQVSCIAGRHFTIWATWEACTHTYIQIYLLLKILPRKQSRGQITNKWPVKWGFSSSSAGKKSVCNAGDPASIHGLERFPGEGIGYPMQYSCLENSIDRGAWQTTVHGVTKSRTQLSDFHFTHQLNKLWCIYTMVHCTFGN